MTASAVATVPGFEYSVRAMGPEDVPFVAATWLRSYADSPWAKRIDQADYFEGHSKVVNALLNRCTVLVAEFQSDEGPVLLGFAAGEQTEHATCLHYAYVKGFYRQRGVADALLTELLRRIGGKRVLCTHRKAPATEVMARRKWGYSPYPLCNIVSRGR